MPASLRVFISSTMRDLQNERTEIVSRISALGLEPVNAEGFLPGGRTSWEKIEEEMRSSHIFVLVLGETYGWEPDEGYGAGSGLSVTHLEYQLAKEIGLPILPFAKELEYTSRERTASQISRDAFRSEVEGWQDGVIRAKFKLAKDLGESVQRAVVEYLCEPHLKKVIGEQDQRVQGSLPIVSEQPRHDVKIEQEIGDLRGNACLLAGAGMSLGAGYPSALAFSESLLRGLGISGETAQPLEVICELYEAEFGRDQLVREAQKIVGIDYTVRPTLAHKIAVKNFRTIVTSNYDQLFEQACQEEGIEAEVYSRFSLPPEMSNTAGRAPLTIFKISGDIRGGELVLTRDDYGSVMNDESLWRYLNHLTWGSPPIVVGHSLSTPDMLKLVQDLTSQQRGVFVSPIISRFAKNQAARLKLKTVSATADDFMASLFD